jgi:hypothetical protein
MQGSWRGKRVFRATLATAVCSAAAFGITGSDAFAAATTQAVPPAAPAAAPVVGECIPDQPIGLAGMRVSIDGHSRRLRAVTPAESAALDKEIDSLIRQDVDALSAQQAADGTLSVVLDGAFMDFAVARIDAAGNVIWDCVGDAAGARAFLNHAAPAAAPALEER